MSSTASKPQSKPQREKRYNCNIRNHKWDRPAGPGAKCLLCPKEWVGVHRGPRKKPDAPAAAPAGTGGVDSSQPMGQLIDLAKLRERWGMTAQAAPAQAQPAPTATTTPAPAPSPASATATVSMGNLAEWLGEPITEFMVELASRRIERKGFQPNAADRDWQEKLNECVDKFLAEKLPKIDMTPFSGAMVAWAAVYVSMRWRAKPLDAIERAELEQLRAEKAKKAAAPPASAGSSPLPPSGPGSETPAPVDINVGAGDTVAAPSSVYLANLLPMDNNWLIGAGGAATGAELSASAA
jgi:hypothetical protein